jgi:hypothetical protein
MNNHFTGSKWARETAKKALPVLVNFAENRRATTYTELAKLLFNDKKYAFPLMAALGRLGKSLESLSQAEPGTFGKVPPIQLIVCNQKTRRPGNLSLSFLGARKSVADAMSKSELNLLVRGAHQTVFDYPRWQEVLRTLGLQSPALNLPPPGSILPKIREIEQHGTGEGEEHRRLKLFLAENPRKIGIRWKGRGDVEELLLSGDRLDVSFRSRVQWIAVEVKGKNSPEADLVRGIFQCVKYKVIMAAQLRYEALRSRDRLQPALPKAVLACGCAFPAALREFAQSLDVEIKSNLIAPEDFVPNKEALRKSTASIGATQDFTGTGS